MAQPIVAAELPSLESVRHKRYARAIVDGLEYEMHVDGRSRHAWRPLETVTKASAPYPDEDAFRRYVQARLGGVDLDKAFRDAAARRGDGDVLQETLRRLRTDKGFLQRVRSDFVQLMRRSWRPSYVATQVGVVLRDRVTGLPVHTLEAAVVDGHVGVMPVSLIVGRTIRTPDAQGTVEVLQRRRRTVLETAVEDSMRSASQAESDDAEAHLAVAILAAVASTADIDDDELREVALAADTVREAAETEAESGPWRPRPRDSVALEPSSAPAPQSAPPRKTRQPKLSPEGKRALKKLTKSVVSVAQRADAAAISAPATGVVADVVRQQQRGVTMADAVLAAQTQISDPSLPLDLRQELQRAVRRRATRLLQATRDAKRKAIQQTNHYLASVNKNDTDAFEDYQQTQEQHQFQDALSKEAAAHVSKPRSIKPIQGLPKPIRKTRRHLPTTRTRAIGPANKYEYTDLTEQLLVPISDTIPATDTSAAVSFEPATQSPKRQPRHSLQETQKIRQQASAVATTDTERPRRTEGTSRSEQIAHRRKQSEQIAHRRKQFAHTQRFQHTQKFQKSQKAIGDQQEELQRNLKELSERLSLSRENLAYADAQSAQRVPPTSAEPPPTRPFGKAFREELRRAVGDRSSPFKAAFKAASEKAQQLNVAHKAGVTAPYERTEGRNLLPSSQVEPTYVPKRAREHELYQLKMKRRRTYESLGVGAEGVYQFPTEEEEEL